MTDLPPPKTPMVSDQSLALVVYVLYFVGYLTGITAVIGVIIAHLQAGQGDAALDTHYRFQIRTFWIGLIYLVVGTVLAFVVVGFLLLAWWFVWSLIRNVKGVLALNRNAGIADPSSWMFG